jgi:Rod binding domain-containing protein
MSAINTSNLPPINPALEPAEIRHGGAAAQRAYQVGLAFEQVLVDQLAQQLTATTGDPSSSSDSGTSDGSSSGSSSGLMGSDPASSMYAQMVPQALTTGVMSAGGVGLALQLAKGIDPALNAPATVKP